jgi:hypothetical protein
MVPESKGHREPASHWSPEGQINGSIADPVASSWHHALKDLGAGRGWYGQSSGEMRCLEPLQASRARLVPSADAISERWPTPKKIRHRLKAHKCQLLLSGRARIASMMQTSPSRRGAGSESERLSIWIEASMDPKKVRMDESQCVERCGISGEVLSNRG